LIIVVVIYPLEENCSSCVQSWGTIQQYSVGDFHNYYVFLVMYGTIYYGTGDENHILAHKFLNTLCPRLLKFVFCFVEKTENTSQVMFAY
jgi:hypothetical protein